MKPILGTLPAAALLAITLAATPFVARADTLRKTERVTMRTPDIGKLPAVDRVVVHKADRKLFLMHGDSIVRSYRIALGLNPIGTKERSGDFRTPEGFYRLVRRN